MNGSRILIACCLALLGASCENHSTTSVLLPHRLTLSQFLVYDDGTEGGTSGSAQCVSASEIEVPIHQIGVITSMDSGRIGPSGTGPAVYAEGEVQWDDLKEMGKRGDLLQVWVSAAPDCMVFYGPGGGV